MKKLLIFTIGVVLFSCGESQSTKNKEESNEEIPCPVTWEDYKPTQDELDFEVKNGIVEKRPNDSTILQMRFGRVWFEMINQTKIDGGASRCYLKNYRLTAHWNPKAMEYIMNTQ